MSQFFNLNLQDVLKGLVVAVLTAIFTIIGPIVYNGALPTMAQLQAAGIAAITAALGYLAKNLFTNSQGQLFKRETK